jgi:ATP/maltotriose-dependent transcriptional regulator MalT
MPFSNFLFLSVVFFFWGLPMSAQTNAIDQLEVKITKQNDVQNYEASIQLISDFINHQDHTAYEKCYAYIFKSYTYKRLFNYEECLHNLDLALEEGLKSDKKEEVENYIKAEKAFVYFDTHKYKKASELMQDLYASNYKYLDSDSKAWIIMQEGCFLFMNKKYAEAEKKLNISLALVLKNSPRNAPNIYGKKIELYNAMKLYAKRDAAFRLGLQYAKKYKIVKYEMYLYEVLSKQHQMNADFKNAYISQQKFDSLTFLYNSINNNGKIQILEKQIDNQKKQLELRHERIKRYFLIALATVLMLLLLMSSRLYIINNQKRILVESENSRIHNDIERLSKAIDEKGNKRLDVSLYILTNRQKEVIGLVQDGKSNKEIASLLFISENTIKYHLKIIYEILDIEHRFEIK